jgi:primosomal protein N' (replication factor Y)
VNHSPAPAEQLELLKSAVRKRRPKASAAAAPELPVAHVVVDLPLAHLDRPFDYQVPATMHEDVGAGCRVKVRFAGRDVDGFVVSRSQTTDHVGALAPIRRVVSAEPVLTPEILETARAVADRYAGTLADVLRLAVPPRHARVEAEELPPRQAVMDRPLDTLAESWATEVGGTALLTRLSAGESPRAVWTAAPGADWAFQLAAAAAATLASERGTIICVPDVHDVRRVEAALATLVGPDAFVVLTADLGPAARYRAFLAAARGFVQIVLGTRAAAFAPVRDLGLVAVWDDGDDSLAEPRAPYPHAREVLLLRAHEQRAGALIGSTARSVEAQALVESGWAVSLDVPRDVVRARAPQVHIAGESDRERRTEASAPRARMPSLVFETVRAALETGPVLVHAPRYGYQPSLTCDTCRVPARCPSCGGPLGRAHGGADPRCRWCGTVADPWSCPHCHGHRLRAPVAGALRAAEEWGRSFPRTLVATSSAEHRLERLDSGASIVIATPGAEPVADGGYAAAVLLDTWLSLSRPDLRAGEESLRRWFAIATLVRPGKDGGRVVAVGEPEHTALQALVRWDPVGYASRELAERRSANLPPASRVASITGTPDQLTEVLAALQLPRYAETFGPVETGPDETRLVLRVPRLRGTGLAKALQQMQAGRSTRKLPPVRVQMDPTELA